MKKIDFSATYGPWYFPTSRDVTVVTVPAMNFAMVDGVGDPNHAAAFREALEALFAVSYTLRFSLKKERIADYRVGPLEALWGEEGGFRPGSPEGWRWTAMILQPDVVSPARFTAAVEEVRRKRDPPALARLRLARFHEGSAVQVLHVGPYSAEAPTIERLHAFAREHGYQLRGRHHEIYLGDPRRSAPARLRTVLRQPIVRRTATSPAGARNRPRSAAP